MIKSKIKVLELDKPNRNNRIYTKKLIEEKVINDALVKEQLANHCLFVELNNSNYDSSTIDSKYVIGIIENLYIEDDALYVEVESITDCKIEEVYLNGVGNVTYLNESLLVNDEDYIFTKFTGMGPILSWSEWQEAKRVD